MKQAQTILEFRQELSRLGWTAQDRGDIDRAYTEACRLFSARFRGGGRPFICHLVGTASIAVEHGADANTACAALLHAAYRQGDFGTHTGRPAKRHREGIAAIVGRETEAMIREYGDLDWSRISQSNPSQLAAKTDGIRPEVLFLRAANELEDSLEYPYYPREEWAARAAGLSAAAQLARNVGKLDLARKIDVRVRILGGCDEAQAVHKSSSYTLIPRSYSEKHLLLVLRRGRATLWHVKQFLLRHLRK